MTALAAFKQLSNHHLIEGALVRATGSATLPVLDPATEDRVGEITDATPAEIERAVEVANRVQKQWRKVNYHKRSEWLHEAAHHMRSAKPLLAEMLTREMGKPFKESADEVIWSSTATDYYAEVARHDAGKVVGPVVDGQFNFTTKDPVGVVVVVLPFNYPLCLLCWQVAAAVACGNTVIIKPSELTTLTTLEFVKAFDVLPPGVVQVLAGGGAVGKALVEHERTHMVAFTGSVPTGRAVAETCARLYKRTLIETSGNDPFIVMPSAPLDTAARGAAFGAFLNCGQVCAASERFYVHEAIHDAFVEKLANYARQVRIGNGLDKVDMGPLACERELKRYTTLLNRAKQEGGKVIVGGGRPSALTKGFFADATVMSDVAPDSIILNTESFGPVAPVCRVRNFDEAIELANRSNYALGSTIYTLDLNESMRAVEELEAGMVWVNAPLLDNDAGPFGGRKQSGIGRQLGAEGLDSFRHTKFTMIDPAAKAHDFWWFPYSDSEGYQGPSKS
jgi:acyl-CoA reductase-like NAD-dependent aldehyde dehydrogenase